MPTSNLLKIVYNKWLQVFDNKMVDLYSLTMDDYNRLYFYPQDTISF